MPRQYLRARQRQRAGRQRSDTVSRAHDARRAICAAHHGHALPELRAAIQADENMGSMSAGREISSMSNDGVSVSFAASGASAAMAASARYMAIIHGWLDGETTEAGVHLLYAGCDA